MSVERISNFQLAEVMAYAEKPYMDIATSKDVSEFEKNRLLELATFAGYTAGKQYTGSLDNIVEQFAPEISPEASELAVLRTEKASDLEQKLSMEFTDIYRNPDFKLGTRAYNCLVRDGIRTVREVVVLGKRKVKEIPNMGQVSIDELQEVISGVIGDQVRWKDEPTPEDIAEICSNLDQVTSRAVSSYINTRCISVQSLLDIPTSDLAKQIKGSQNGIYSESGARLHADEIKLRANEFAERFNKARSQT